jgi:hypothetical protein
MKSKLQWAFWVGAFGFFILGSNAMAQSSGSGCTREDLKAITDKFFAALQEHKPSGVLLASGVKYTENGLAVEIGKGIWETAGKPTFKRGMVDTKKCSTHTQTIMEENGNPILYAVRLKVDRGGITGNQMALKISEIEAFVIREKAQVGDVKVILDTKDQDWESILPPEQRSSRLALMAIADDYFELFVAKDKKPKVSELPFLPPCDRWENGVQTTKGGTNMGVTMPAHNCSPKGFADMTETHQPRRFLVDEETGIVVAYVLFNNSWPDFHMFKVKNSHVDWIHAYFEWSKTYKTVGWPNEPACK